jgi:hypothetical protein
VITCYSDHDEVYILDISVSMVYYILPVFKILAVGFLAIMVRKTTNLLLLLSLQ